MKKEWILLPSGVAFGVVIALGLSSWAEDTELDAGPRAIPYNGILEFNGQSFTGQADIQFTLTDDGECTFVEDHEDVRVFAGRFSVNVGQPTGDLPTCLFDSEAVFLQMAVRSANEQTPHVALAGRQRINPVPFAYWAAEGSDFRIDGNANIGGDANITGSVAAANANITGNVAANSANITGNISANNGTFNGAVQANSVNSTFLEANIGTVNTLNSAQATVNNIIRVNGTADVNGPADISGNTNIGGNITVGGTLSDPNSALVVADGMVVTGAIQPRTNNNAIDWANDAFGGGGGDDAWIRYYSRSGENASLQLGINNDTADHLEFYQAGAVRMSVAGGNVVTHNNHIVQGYTDMGVRLVRCATPNTNIADCTCDPGEFAISGGGFRNGDAGISSSRPIFYNNRWHWRIECLHTQGNDEGQGQSCNQLFAICARISVDDSSRTAGAP